MKLTATEIRAIELPPGVTDRVYFDERLPGFGLRVRANGGAASWLVQYGKPAKRITLGLLTGLNPSDAFATAKTLLAQVRLGRDPVVEKAQAKVKAAETFGALLPRFLDRQRAKLKARSYPETERYLSSYAKPLHRLPIESIERRTIAGLLAGIAKAHGPVAANRARAALSAFFNWAAREGYLGANPASYTNKAIENGARDRVLADGELAAILAALRDDDYGAIVQLLMLLGLRREEVGGLRWQEVDLDAATIALPEARTKNGRATIVPLSAPALAILQARAARAEPGRAYAFGRGAGAFSGWSKAKAELDARIAAARQGQGLAPWTLHDFRRAFSTALHEFGVSPHVVEALLGHVSGHQGGIAGVYNRAAYLDERRRTLDSWAEHVTALAAKSAAP